MEHLTVTCVKPSRGFLHIYGHKKPELLDQLNAEISAYKPFIKKIAASDELYPNPEFDTIYLALSAETERYHRCTVREKRPNNKAIIDLIDYGNDFEVDTQCLLELDPKNRKSEFLKDFPPIATKYILANFFCTWKTQEISVIKPMLHRTKLPITNEQTDRDFHFISLNFNGMDLANKLINSGIGMEISFTEQRMEVRRQSQRLYDVFDNGPATSPARREKRRNLVPNRPLQTNNNNNTITDQSKRMIQNVVMSNKPSSQRNNYMPSSESTVVDGIVQSSTAASSVATPTTAPAKAVQTPSRIPTFTASELSIGQFHTVYCSYVEDGPNLFWCQLKSQEHVLDRMASYLANAPRNPITTKVSIGMACIARFSEDHALYRAVIQKVQPDGCRVTFIDYGNSEFVSYDELYEIPNEFLEHKTFAWSFQLHGCKELNLTNKRLLDYFESLVCNENVLDLRVIPTNNIQVQQCELFIANGKSVLDILRDKMSDLNTYPPALELKHGDMVVIRTALNAKKFFVQSMANLAQFDAMMDDLFQFCINAPQPKKLPIKGASCAAMAHGDSNEWYRAIVLDILDSQRVQLQFVDYGMEMPCRLSELREIPPRFLELPRQAIECCLADFETIVDVSDMTGKQMTMLIDDSNREPIPYKVLLRRRLPNGVYVLDLHDEAKDLSVSLSVYKLAMPRRPYNNKSTKPPAPAAAAAAATAAATINEVEKPQRSMPNNRTNGQSMREGDGAESQEKFHEATDAPKDRYSSNKSTSDDDSFRSNRSRGASAAPRNENGKTRPNAPVANAPAKNYGKRSDYDNNRRYNDQSKRPTLQKQNIPRFNKRSNRSRNNHNGKRTIGVDNNDNWTVDGDSTHGSQSINVDVSSNGTEKGEKSQPKLTPDVCSEPKIISIDRPSPVRQAPPPPPVATAPTPTPTEMATPPPALAATATPPVTVKETIATPPATAPVASDIPDTTETSADDAMTSVAETISTLTVDNSSMTHRYPQYLDTSLALNTTQSTTEMPSSMTKAPAVDNNDNNVATKSRDLAFITHVDNPNRFYIQLNSDTNAIESIHESLQIVAPQLPALREFRAGELCIGKFSLDDLWYRAKIIDTDGEITSIQFIDFGNTDSITNNAFLKAPDDTLMAREPLAMACSLPIAPHGDSKIEWAENASEKLRMLTSDTPIEIELVSKYQDINYVKVFLVGGRDLVREMIQEEVADPLEIIELGETCYISHINSLSDFYIQVDSDTEVLTKIELHLEQNRDSSILTEPHVGQICSAQFEDGQFYRARILDIIPETKRYQVEFLDYGNVCVTTEIRTLNSKIADLPYLRKHCQLQMPNDVHEWSEQAEQKFHAISNDGATAFKVHLMKPGKPACVELIIMENGAELSSVLGELCEKRPDPQIHLIDEQDPVAVSMLSDIMEEATSMSND